MPDKKQNLSEYNLLQIPCIKHRRVAIVTAEWNSIVTSAMEKACIETLQKHGLEEEDDIVRHYVAGSYELPFIAKKIVHFENVDAVICIGCIVQGETKHFDFIAQAVSNGIMQVGLETGVPVIFGVLTTNNMQQAVDRAGGAHGNKGVEAAIACLKLLALEEKFDLPF